MTNNVIRHRHKVTRSQRARIKGQKPCLLWFTGLSGSGKSTISSALDLALHQRGYHTFLLDGDNVRLGLSNDLGFSARDRSENIRRVGEVSKLFLDAGLIVLSAFISPFASDRRLIRKLMPAGEFIEIFMDTPLATCEQRDSKGLYKQVRIGKIENFTGIDSPYEAPQHPEIRLNTSSMSVDECVETLIDYLVENGRISGPADKLLHSTQQS